MEEVVSVYIADVSESFRELLAETLELEGNILVVGMSGDGEVALAELERLRPRVLIMDLMLHRKDGLSLMRTLRESGAVPRILVVSGFYNDRLAEQVCRMGVDFYLPKPCAVEDIARCIRLTLDGDRCKNVKSVEETVRQLIMAYGTLPNLSGFRYLLRALVMMYTGQCPCGGVTKILYPELAKEFGTTDKCVERSIGRAIKQGWKAGSPAERERVFGSAFSSFTKIPTNSQFMAIILEQLNSRFAPGIRKVL